MATKHQPWTTRTIEGITLTRLRAGEGGLDAGWEGVIEGETWRFVQQGDRKWQGYTVDHTTGTARSFSLKRTVAWVIEHRDEWLAKVSVRRRAGTRMVDPAA